MAYADKQKEKEVKRQWAQNNPDRIKAMRERWNEKRRQRREDEAYRAGEAAAKRKLRKNMTPEETEAYYASRREYQRNWQKAHYKETYARMKARMAEDPEYAAKIKAQWTARNGNRVGRPKPEETPEQREKRLQRNREYYAKKAREKKMMEALHLAPPKEPKRLVRKAEPKKLVVPTRKPGRLVAMAGWHRW